MQPTLRTSILTAVAALATSHLALAAGITNYSSHAPPAVTLPAAGGHYWDPVFGTKIIRVTDSTRGTHCVHAYAYWPAFNINDTKLLISCDDVPQVYKFDPTTDTVWANGALYGTIGGASPHIQFEGASWSHTDPTILYAVDAHGLRLWKIDVTVRGLSGYHLLRDFTGKFPAGQVLSQLMVSDDDNVFSFHMVDTATGATHAAVAWVRSVGKTYSYESTAYQLDECKVMRLVEGLLPGPVCAHTIAFLCTRA